MEETPHHAPTWLFGITILPFGVSAGFAAVAMPFMLRKAGVPVDHIAGIGSLVLMPSTFQFLWAPMIDIGLPRRAWLILVSALGAACIGGALLLRLPDQLSLFIPLMVLGQGLLGLVGSCNGALMATTLPNEIRGQAGGFYNAGNLGGAALGGGLTLGLAELVPDSPGIVGLALALMIFLPSLTALWIEEAPRVSRPGREIFRAMLRDVWSTLNSKAGLTGILICSSPVGTVAAMGLFSSIAEDYHATPGMVWVATGVFGGLITAVGSLIGGFLCDRISRRKAYIAAGCLTILTSTGLALAPLTPSAYLIGSSIYLFVAGLCYAAFSALVLEVVGRAGASAATQYTLFSAAGNFAIMYTGLFVGQGYTFHHLGPMGMFGADALANGVGVVFLLIVMSLVFRKGKNQPGLEAA